MYDCPCFMSVSSGFKLSAMAFIIIMMIYYHYKPQTRVLFSGSEDHFRGANFASVTHIKQGKIILIHLMGVIWGCVMIQGKITAMKTALDSEQN